MDAIRGFGASLWKTVSDTATQLLGAQNADGKPAVVDILPSVINTGASLIGAPELPPAEMALAMGGLEDLLVLLSNQNSEAKLKAAEGLAAKLLPGLVSAAAGEIAKHAGNSFISDLAKGMVKWVSTNPGQAAMLLADIGRVIGTAVATGGVSLAADLPLLLPKLASTASGILTAAGISPEKFATNLATDLLKFLGVNDVDAEKAGRIIGTLSVLGADIALAVATQGKHPINPKLVQEAVQQIALVSGVQPDTAAVVAAGAAMAFTLGQNFAGFVLAGNPPESFGGLDKIFTNVESVASEAVKMFMGQEGASPDKIMSKLMELGPLFQAFAQTVTENASAANPDYGTKGWEAVNKHLRGLIPELGSLLDGMAKLAEA